MSAGSAQVMTGVALVTVSEVEPDTDPTVALTVVFPAARALASPPAVIVAKAELVDVQVAVAVTSAWESSV
jgi:hypothetical protein